MSSEPDIVQTTQDISPSLFAAALKQGSVAIDTETSGLDFHYDRLATVQVFVPGYSVEIVRVTEATASRLVSCLEHDSIQKVFHNAMFDLRFLCKRWGVRPQNIVCTKIGAKLLAKSGVVSSTSLKPLVERYLDVMLDKSAQLSDWSADLSQSQVKYAANDVLYLEQLLTAISVDLEAEGLTWLARRCWDHVPARVALDLGGFGDVFEY